MNKSNALVVTGESKAAADYGRLLKLEFPIAPDFISRPLRVEPKAMLARIAETLPWRSSRPGEAERRLAEKVDVEFVL